MLQEEGKREEYAERTKQLWDEGDRDERVGAGEWEKASEVMMRAAKEVCGVCEKRVTNPWAIGHEEVIEGMVARVNEAVNERNKYMTALNARRRLRTRVSANVRGRRDDRTNVLEARLVEARAQVRNARKEVKRFMRRIEKTWWEERIAECRNACDRGRIGDMYKCLRKIGTKGGKAPESTTITVSEFKEHFERVSKERYEEDPSVIASVIERVEDMRGNERARCANERLMRLSVR